MAHFAKASIWLFFILIIDQPLVIAAFKYGAPIRPVVFYAVVALALATSALVIERSIQPLKSEWIFFSVFAALVLWGFAMYRGENPGPNFDQPTLIAFHTPSRIGYAVWPAINLTSCAALFMLARHDRFKRTIIMAAFFALVIQVLAMEADMWWPSLFGDPNGRAGGFAQNANVAALLVCLLASMTLPSHLGGKITGYAAYAVPLALAAVLFSQSRAGGLMLFAVVTCLIIASQAHSPRWPQPIFSIALLATVIATAALSPALHTTQDQVEKRIVEKPILEEQAAVHGHSKPATLDTPVTLEERIASRLSVDESAGARERALRFFIPLFLSNPLGLGTGFSNKFLTGPHNTWLKLAVDQGFLAPILFSIMLGVAIIRSWQTKSPILAGVTFVSTVASILYHTVFVEPIVPASLAIALGVASSHR